MWQIPKQTVTLAMVVLFALMFCSNAAFYFIAKHSHLSIKKWLLIFLIITSPLILSNNALSHDVFNYIFNARMVVKYQVDPHVRVAMDFMYDPWTRFMHNVHTPAPYFYGWTFLSVIPYLLGFEKFLLTWILFRLWSELGLILSMITAWLLVKKSQNLNQSSLLILVLFNPLLIIELISNSHNDGWMMWPALGSFLLLYPSNDSSLKSWIKVIVSCSLLLVSMSTKYASVLLIPVWILLLIQNQKILNRYFQKQGLFFQKLSLKTQLNIFDIAAMLMFLPLLSSRSQQFHPWYLSWSLIFFPLMKNRFLRYCLLILSASSLFRYVPWLWNGGFEYTPEILLNQKLITWVPVIVGIMAFGSYQMLIKSSKKDL